jgi:hypothetical protein
MCRSIKTLRTPTPATEDEIRAAALQFVRKVSGFRAPAPKNAEAFQAAVEEISASTGRLLGRLPPSRATSERPARLIGVRPTTPH